MLLIDCGNSTLKAQYRPANRVQASFACAYRGPWTEDFERWLGQQPAAPVYIASVLDRERQARLDACLQRYRPGAVTRLRSQAACLGVSSAYAQPERLGVDRWLALLAAAEICAGDCIVIDAGSAITLDLLRADGQHLGGAILPGINTSAERFRQIFSHIDFDAPGIGGDGGPGGSTEAAIQLDYRGNSLQQVHALVERWSPLLNDEAEILLAGGDAACVQRALGRAARIVPDLVFRGMARLAGA